MLPRRYIVAGRQGLTELKWLSGPLQGQYLGPQGHNGPPMGLIRYLFTARSNWVDRRFAQKGPYDRKNPTICVFGPFRAPDSLNTAKSFQGTALCGAPRPRNAKKIALEMSFFQQDFTLTPDSPWNPPARKWPSALTVSSNLVGSRFAQNGC